MKGANLITAQHVPGGPLGATSLMYVALNELTLIVPPSRHLDGKITLPDNSSRVGDSNFMCL